MSKIPKKSKYQEMENSPEFFYGTDNSKGETKSNYSHSTDRRYSEAYSPRSEKTKTNK